MNKRVDWLDISKGITIILMVLGHSSIPNFVSNFIWAFHMPLFFIASGWCTNWGKCKFSEFFLSKVKTLLMPFALYSCIVLCVKELMGRGNFVNVVLYGWHGYTLWFIPVLFLALMLSKLIMSINAKQVQLLLWLLTAVVGAGFSYARLSLPWTLCTVPYASFLIILGSKAKCFQKFVDKPRWWILLLGFFITALISHFYRMDMAWNHVTPVFLLSIGACAGTAMMFSVSSFVQKYTKFTASVLRHIGKETYIILAFSQLIIIICNQYLSINAVVKYAFLVLMLFLLVVLKNYINRIYRIVKQTLHS